MAKINIRLHELLNVMKENDAEFFREGDSPVPCHPLIPEMGCAPQNIDQAPPTEATKPQKMLLRPGGINEDEIMDILGVRPPPPSC